MFNTQFPGTAQAMTFKNCFSKVNIFFNFIASTYDTERFSENPEVNELRISSDSMQLTNIQERLDARQA